MPKVTLGPRTVLYPLPAVLIGASVEGKPNFMTAAWCGIACSEPPMISVALRHSRHTLKGVEENMTFSVNVPSVTQHKEVDYCGIVSGSTADKVRVCGFKVFYGKLENAPMIEQCPVNLECRVEHTLDLGSHVLLVGKIEETHVSASCMTGGNPDAKKVRPLIFTPLPESAYHGLGEAVSKAFKVGLELKR